MTRQPPRRPAAAAWLSIAAEERGPFTVVDDDPPEPSPDVVERAGELVGQLRSLLGPDEVYDGLTTARLRTHLDDLHGLVGVAAAARARAGQAFHVAGGTKEDGAPNLRAVYRRQGLSDHEAARTAALARDLDHAPAVARAMADGDITAESAGEILKAKRNGRLGEPADVEQELLRVARDGNPNTLRTHIRAEEQRRDGDALRKDEARQHQHRAVSLHQQRDGMWNLRGSLPAMDGEKAKTLLEALSTWDPEDTPKEHQRSTVQRTADAFMDAVDWMLDHRDLPTSGGKARPHVTVTAPAATVTRDLTDPATGQAITPDDPAWADLPPGYPTWGDVPLSPQTIRQLCCDANLTRLLTDANSMPLDVGRATRTWSGSQRTAITNRDGGCRGPSCDRPVGWTEIHHVQWWRHDGPTNLDNGLLLCRRCHRLVHDDGWTVELDPMEAAAVWTSPGGDVTTTFPHHRHRHRRRAD